jgi:hypothetical protein
MATAGAKPGTMAGPMTAAIVEAASAPKRTIRAGIRLIIVLLMPLRQRE